MKIIIGLGNPGSEYAHTRHNIGFEVIDELAARHHIDLNRTKFNALFGKGLIDGQEVLLVKPLTYMNASGEAAGPLVHFYKLTPDDVLAIHDDMDLPVGRIRLRQKGSSGGHNGVKSLIQHLHTQEFARIRVGVGHPERSRQVVINYVLNGFTEEEKTLIADAIDRASEAAAAWLTLPFPKVMSEYNANK
ncbi:aminoacyl-tRNA hydrolase [Sporolactobacillus shoreae]|uniref:Peptidyl-tRNA hydrolase n=1 Tax=Sporolactobacillus shoreae TaxID=1465501 RepID=A0A4Z0GL71_9BACL|nr:aminoacyl-tRNA hydrolase [Sporolactobacillus shoreae]TGA96526.1 aminoacyl-tRNA hydrolase [Sporolactobacillus shoreae]